MILVMIKIDVTSAAIIDELSRIIKAPLPFVVGTTGLVDVTVIVIVDTDDDGEV